MANVTLTEAKRTDLGRKLSQYVEAGKNTLGRMPLWWRECERMHRNEGVNSRQQGEANDPDGGMPRFHVPFSQPRQDMLTAQVCAVIGKQSPYLRCTSDEEEVADAKDEVLDLMLRDAHFERKIRQQCSIATDTDLAYFRWCPLAKGSGRTEIQVVHPSDMIVYPALASGFDDATVIGHQLFKPRWAITNGQEKGPNDEPAVYYKKAEVLSQSDVQSEDATGHIERSGADLSDQGPEPEQDAPVELWDVLWRVRLDGDKTERLYRATLALKDQELLALEPYPFREVWYFEARLIGSREYYPATSVGRNLMPLQEATDYLSSAVYAGTMMSAAPPIIGPKLSDSRKFERAGPNQYIETAGGQAQPWSPNVHPILAPAMQLMADYERIGDQVARISANTTGSQVVDQTATEASIVASGVAVGIEEYISNFSFDLPRAGRFGMELLDYDWEGFQKRLNIVDPDDVQDGPLSLPAPTGAPEPEAPTDEPPGFFGSLLQRLGVGG